MLARAPIPLMALLLTLSAPSAGSAQARKPLVQSVEIRVPLPPAPVMIAGSRYLAYELHITNFRPADVALRGVEVLDADRGTRLAELRDSALTRSIGVPGVRPETADRRIIGSGRRAVVFLWLALDDTVTIPSSLRHAIEYELSGSSGRERGIVAGGASAVPNAAPLVLGPPLRGGPWVAVYEPAMEHGHRTSIYTIDGGARIPGRFAIDWIRLDRDGQHARGDGSLIADWHGFGAEVLAVADAVVADAIDDMAEDPAITTGPSRPVALEYASGNHVTLDLGGGRHAFYEHLKHGSLRVRPGDRVKRGDVIGLLGNTGSSSSGPHLHFHVADGRSPLAAEGLPYVIGEFDVLGAFGSIEASLAGRPWNAAPSGSGGTRRMELPAANTVVTFPEHTSP